MIAFFLDLGTKTGWAKNKHGVVTSGTQNLSKGNKYTRFSSFLVNSVFSECPNKIYYEKVMAHKGTYASHTYGGYEAILSMMCDVYKTELIPIPVGTIKKKATGSGKAKKTEVIKAVEAIGYRPKDDNEADALAMCIFCC